MKRETWASRSTFILAAIGSAVGLGNAWRFPGLAAKHGGGAFLLVYLIAMLAVGVPLLMLEIAVGRRIRQGTPGAMRAMNRKAEAVGWIAVSNAVIIEIYYAVVFAWVILMFVVSHKFAGLTGNSEAASKLWLGLIQTTGTTEGFGTFCWPVFGCFIVAWISAFWCIRNGAQSVGKVVKYTVSLPVICLLILAIRGFTMPAAGAGLAKLFIPDWSALSNSALWVDAIGQIFYSLSVAMAIMVAYGSFLDRKSNIAVDSLIIAFSDLAISVLAGIVMFTTMAGVGMLDSISASGISTAFIIYPQAIVNLTNVPWINAAFAYIFYFCLITLAIDSLFSIVEGASTAISDKFHLNKRRTTLSLCIISAVLGLVFCTAAGLALLDIVDNFVNSYTLLLTGVLEAIVAGWCFKTSKILDEINHNADRFRMPAWWFNISIKYVAPIALFGIFVWNLITLFAGGGIYGAADGYSLASNLICGWALMGLSLISGGIVKLIARARVNKGGYKEDLRSWDEIPETEEGELK
ncbi:MAG: sodium-dependent transporter [Eubacteriales bacterium]|nr:sodium-dependent transporter [Eubacteriales bacterium]MDY5016769.1 sodium-dependent transporter [Eubacteriales bacterium]